MTDEFQRRSAGRAPIDVSSVPWSQGSRASRAASIDWSSRRGPRRRPRRASRASSAERRGPGSARGTHSPPARCPARAREPVARHARRRARRRPCRACSSTGPRTLPCACGLPRLRRSPYRRRLDADRRRVLRRSAATASRVAHRFAGANRPHCVTCALSGGTGTATREGYGPTHAVFVALRVLQPPPW